MRDEYGRIDLSGFEVRVSGLSLIHQAMHEGKAASQVEAFQIIEEFIRNVLSYPTHWLHG